MEETTTPKQKKRAKLPKLKPSEKVFAHKYVENDENGTQTVKEVYGIEDEGYARLKAHRLITKDNVRTEIEIVKETLKSALIKKGITPEKIAEKIDVLLEASKPIFKNNNSTGEIEQVGEEIDYTAVDKGIKHATTIYGVEDPDKPKGNTTYNFILNQSFKEKIKPLEDELKTQFRNARPIQEL